MDERLFMFTNEGNYEQHQLVRIDDTGEAARLVSEGKAVKVSLQDYDTYRQKAKQARNDYDRARKRITESKNPYYQNPQVRDYEISNITQKFEDASKEIQAEWEAKRAELQQQARGKSARATAHVTEADKATAGQFASRLSLNVAQASSTEELNTAIARAIDDVAYFSEGQKTATQGKLTDVIMAVQSKADTYASKASVRELVSAVQDTRNMDLLAGKVADQLPLSVTDEYRRLKTVRGGNIFADPLKGKAGIK